MSLETILKALPFVILVVQGLMGWGMWSLSQRFVSRSECTECQKDHGLRIGAVERMIAVGEARNATQLTRDDLGKVYERLNSVGGRVDEQVGEVKAMRRTLDMINQHLMRGE